MSTQTLTQLRELKLGGMAAALQTQLEQVGTYEGLSFLERLHLLVEHERLSTEVFPDLKLGLLHGRLALREKERIMGQFKDGEIDILAYPFQEQRCRPSGDAAECRQQRARATAIAIHKEDDKVCKEENNARRSGKLPLRDVNQIRC